MRNLLILFAFLSFVFMSCEDNMILKSGKKIKNDLQGKWLRNFQGYQPYVLDYLHQDTVYYNEYWTFNDDKLYTTFTYSAMPQDFGTPDSVKSDNVDTVVVSGFKIDARLLKAFLKLQLVSGANDTAVNNRFVDKWQFIQLSHDVLYLAADDPSGSGVVQREFSRVQ